MEQSEQERKMISKMIAVMALVFMAGCHARGTYYKDYETDKDRGGLYVYWIERNPVSNRFGICAEIYSQWGHFDGKYDGGKWGGENHRKDAPWDTETKSHVGFAEFATQKEAEAWGDSMCPN